ncbi:MAG: SIR2 family protein [Acidimicrobiales bacterium]
MDQGELITQYGRHVDARTAAVFIGAGLSMSAGYPSWSELLEPLRKQLGIDPVYDLSLLAQYYADATPSGRKDIQDLIADQFADLDLVPTLAHQLLARLPIDEFWTTNYDTLLERAVDGAVVIVDDQQLAQAIDPGSRLVYKMHGSVTQPRSAVLTRDDYDRYPDQHPRFWHLLRAQVLTTTFLFLGFGFSDPNLDLVFQLVRLRTADIKRDHFTIMKRPGRDDPSADHALFKLRIGQLGRAGVHVVVVDSYDEIALILGKLVARCRPPQLMISGSTPSTRPPADAAAPYPTSPVPDALASTAKLLGAQLARTGASVVGGSEVAAIVGYELMRTLAANHTYDPRRFTLLRRQQDQPLDAPNLRLGRIAFTGEVPNDLRSAALAEVRALIILGGASGTQAEVDQALEIGLGIVPVASTGGTARDHWERMQEHLDQKVLGGQPIDPVVFDNLASPESDRAVAAAVRLATQALYLSDSPSPPM